MSLRKLGGFSRQAASYATIASSRASIQPLTHRPGSKVQFGAVVQGVGINNISGECMERKAKGETGGEIAPSVYGNGRLG